MQNSVKTAAIDAHANARTAVEGALDRECANVNAARAAVHAAVEAARDAEIESDAAGENDWIAAARVTAAYDKIRQLRGEYGLAQLRLDRIYELDARLLAK